MTAPRWPSRAGACLGIGSAPGALLLGAGIAARQGGVVPILVAVAGLGLVTALLAGQGRLGLAPPEGAGESLTGLAPTYLGARTRTVLAVLLTLVMVGWFGFNMGLGGAATAALLGVPGWAGPLLLGVPTALVAAGGMGRWNVLAVLATGSALVLTLLVTVRLAAPGVPLGGAVADPAGALADIASFIGYGAVFALRAPDFTAGLGRPRDLAWCVGLLVVPLTLVTLAGAGLYRGTGSTDLVATLAEGDLALGNVLVALAMIAPTLAALHSASLALGSLRPVPTRVAVAVVAVPGLLLAVLRFDRLLLSWLAVLAAALPALIVPMAVEGVARRRGRAPRQVPVWTWAPASVVAVALTAAGVAGAPLAGLGLAALGTAAWQIREKNTGRPSGYRPRTTL